MQPRNMYICVCVFVCMYIHTYIHAYIYIELDKQTVYPNSVTLREPRRHGEHLHLPRCDDPRELNFIFCSSL